jgi:uncharacterized protein RhaS with RHS repeats
MSATYQDGSTMTYIYDAGNRLTQVVDSISGTITRAYDNFDRLTQEVTRVSISRRESPNHTILVKSGCGGN